MLSKELQCSLLLTTPSKHTVYSIVCTIPWYCILTKVPEEGLPVLGLKGDVHLVCAVQLLPIFHPNYVWLVHEAFDGTAQTGHIALGHSEVGRALCKPQSWQGPYSVSSWLHIQEDPWFKNHNNGQQKAKTKALWRRMLLMFFDVERKSSDDDEKAFSISS